MPASVALAVAVAEAGRARLVLAMRVVVVRSEVARGVVWRAAGTAAGGATAAVLAAISVPLGAMGALATTVLAVDPGVSSATPSSFCMAYQPTPPSAASVR